MQINLNYFVISLDYLLSLLKFGKIHNKIFMEGKVLMNKKLVFLDLNSKKKNLRFRNLRIFI